LAEVGSTYNIIRKTKTGRFLSYSDQNLQKIIEHKHKRRKFWAETREILERENRQQMGRL
jgi:hypothetical protein